MSEREATTAAAYEGVDETSRKVEWMVLKRLASVRGRRVAEALGKDESTISRISSSQTGIPLRELGKFLDLLDLKVVDKAVVCLRADVAQAYATLVRRATQDANFMFHDDQE